MLYNLLMQWMVELRRGSAEHGLAWVRHFFDRYDTASLDCLKIDAGNPRYEGVYGQCQYPTKNRLGFRIYCHMPGPFPCTTVTRKPPLYRRPDGTFPRAPRGCRRGVLCYDPRTVRHWYRLLGKTRLETLDEAVVWIVSHEAFHFLRHTRQVPGRNTEIDADLFADDGLAEFQAGYTRATAPIARPLWRQLLLPWTQPLQR